MYNQAFDKVNGGDAFGYSFMVFMALIVEGHRSPIIGINPGSGNDGPAQTSYFYFTKSGEKIYITEARKPSKIKGFGNLTIA